MTLFDSFFLFLTQQPPPTQWAMASTFLRFLDHTQRRITVGRTPLDESSDLRKELYLKKHSTHNRQTSMPLMGFEPKLSAGQRPQTDYLEHTGSGTGAVNIRR